MHGVNNGRLLLVAAAFGVFADALLQVTPWGLNVALVVLGGIVAAGILSHWSGVALSGEGRWLALAAVFFAAALVWRASPTLSTANACALVVSVSLAALTAREGQIRVAGITQYAVGALYMFGFSLAGLAPVLLREVPWRGAHRGPTGRVALAATRGVVLAVPPLIVFALLLAAADANFEHFVHDLLDVDLTRLALVALYTWLVGGTLREMLLAPERPRPWSEPPARLTIGTIELSVVLGLLDLLFLAFVVLQVPYLFGGREQVAALGYSAYARRGFFELVWVVGLALPLLLVLHWLLPRDRPAATRAFRVLAALMVGLLFAIVASAMQRMQIYVVDNGLTELRVQSSALMVWLSVVLVWFLATVLRGQRARFAFGALVSAFVVIGALDALNPDAAIVNINASYGHLLNQGRVDELAMASLSADATPAIVAALPHLPEAQRAEIERRLERRHLPEPSDWRAFNWSRHTAAEALSSAR